MNIKNKNCIFTIATPSHFFDAVVALQSAKKYNRNVDCCMFYMDYECPYKYTSINILTIKDIQESFGSLYTKYRDSMDKIRWSLKPVIMLYLLNFYYKSIYIDTDIYFVNPWNFLFDKIDHMLLTPHYRYLKNHSKIMYDDMSHGFFNAGFIGASRLALEPLRFWANCCFHRCEKNPELGLYDDQKYLDIIYMMKSVFSGIDQLNHYGVNVAPWNVGVGCMKLSIENLRKHKIWINKDLLICIHLNKKTYSSINNDNKKIFFNYFDSKYIKIKNKIKDKTI